MIFKFKSYNGFLHYFSYRDILTVRVEHGSYKEKEGERYYKVVFTLKTEAGAGVYEVTNFISADSINYYVTSFNAEPIRNHEY